MKKEKEKKPANVTLSVVQIQFHPSVGQYPPHHHSHPPRAYTLHQKQMIYMPTLHSKYLRFDNVESQLKTAIPFQFAYDCTLYKSDTVYGILI